MVPDPYKALGVSHDASALEIKTAYRKLALQYHPDRLTRQQAPPEECQRASEKFAQISAAYALLTDDKRKRDYDHVYKYGGYDDNNNDDDDDDDIRDATHRKKVDVGGGGKKGNNHEDPFCPFPRPNGGGTTSVGGKRTLQKGIGYSVSDPFAYLFSQGQRRATTVAGIQIPSRMQFSNHHHHSNNHNHSSFAASGSAGGGGGLRFAFSSAQFTTCPNGARQYVSKTTQFVQGKKYTRVETTTVHPDGRKEIVIEGNDYVERHSTPPKKKKKQQQEPASSSSSSPQEQEDVTPKEDVPWYMEAWNGLRDKLSMCYNPCGIIQAQ